MGTCDEIFDLLSARLDGELTAEQATALAEHLAACPECAALAHDLERIHSLMPGLNVTPPAAIMENVMARIGAEEAKVVSFPTKRQPSRQWRAMGAAAAVFAVVLAGTFALRGGMSNGASGGEPVMMNVPPPAAVPSSAPSASAVIEPRSMPTEEEYGVMPSTENAVAEDGLEYAGRGETVFTHKDTAPVPTPTAAADAEVTAAAGVAPRMAQATTGVTAVPPSPPPITTFSSQTADARLYSSFSGTQTPQSACQALFEHLNAQNYPDLGDTALWEGAALTGTAETDDLAYTLVPVTVEGETYTWRLAYVGLSQNHKYHEFHLYAEVMDGTVQRTVQGGWYGIAVADGTILTAQDDMDAYEIAVNEE